MSRGTSQVEVTFSLDTDGLLSVTARDLASGQETSAALNLVAVTQSQSEIARMQQRQAGIQIR